jgi:hypothetical protein
VVRPIASPADLLRTTSVREDPGLAGELARRAATAGPFPIVSVTDLLSPRAAYWRRAGPPVPREAAREAVLEAGRTLHRRALLGLAGEGRIEVRMRRLGVAGRIDLLSDLPTELKTRRVAEGSDPRAPRPSELDQLSLYCALADLPAGRLVRIDDAPGGELRVSAWEAKFAGPASGREEVARRSAALREALLPGGRPDQLPRCPWWSRGCEFQAAGVCGCSGVEPEEDRTALAPVGPLRERPDLAARWTTLIQGQPPSAAGSGGGRFRDLVYPRRAFFERVTVPGPEPSPAPVERPAAPSLYERLLAAAEGGPVGEVCGLPPARAAPEEEVTGFAGAPYLLRTSRAWSRLAAHEVNERAPQYGFELGLRAAATGVGVGRAFLAYEHAEHEGERYQVLEYRFRDLEPFARFLEDEAAALERAVADGDPSGLAPCPRWMYEGCPYRPACGCGSEPGRSQR